MCVCVCVYIYIYIHIYILAKQFGEPWRVGAGKLTGVYRGTSLIRNAQPPRITIGP